MNRGGKVRSMFGRIYEIDPCSFRLRESKAKKKDTEMYI